MEKTTFSDRLRPDWGNTTRAAMTGLGSIVLYHISRYKFGLIRGTGLSSDSWGTFHLNCS